VFSKRGGFNYAVSLKQIRDYSLWPLEKRLAWLYQGNLLRKAYPKRIREIQDKFRKGLL
jgi:hypothetical protein